jgi:hypothetical protein
MVFGDPNPVYLEFILFDLGPDSSTQSKKDQDVNCDVVGVGALRLSTGEYECTVCSHLSKQKNHMAEHIESKHIDNHPGYARCNRLLFLLPVLLGVSCFIPGSPPGISVGGEFLRINLFSYGLSEGFGHDLRKV